MKQAYLIGFLVVGVALGFTLWAFSGTMTPYVDIRTARQSVSPVQVRGRILHETAHYDLNKKALCFTIEDINKDKIEVVYFGATPEAFDQAPETAATGVVRRSPSGGEFLESRSMVVKCPSKYEDEQRTPYKKAVAGGGSGGSDK